MKCSKVGFRKVYKKFCLFDMTDTFRRALVEFPIDVVKRMLEILVNMREDGISE